MLYTFNLCPKCKDKLVKQDVAREEDYKKMYCPNCGREMTPALAGEEKLRVCLNKSWESGEGN